MTLILPLRFWPDVCSLKNGVSFFRRHLFGNSLSFQFSGPGYAGGHLCRIAGIALWLAAGELCSCRGTAILNGALILPLAMRLML